jgi:hypothetical protein
MAEIFIFFFSNISCQKIQKIQQIQKNYNIFAKNYHHIFCISVNRNDDFSRFYHKTLTPSITLVNFLEKKHKSSLTNSNKKNPRNFPKNPPKHP